MFAVCGVALIVSVLLYLFSSPSLSHSLRSEIYKMFRLIILDIEIASPDLS